MYSLVDYRDRANERTCPVPDGHALPAVLQRPNRFHQGRGTFTTMSHHVLRSCCYLIEVLTWSFCGATVLAVVHHVSLLRPLLARSSLPRILPSALFPSAGGVVWPLSRPFLVAHGLLDDIPDRPIATRLDALPRPPAVLNAGIHMVATKPRHQAELPRTAGLHRAVSALGLDGIQSRDARHSAEGRDHGRRDWPHLVLLHRCIPSYAQRLSPARSAHVVAPAV